MGVISGILDLLPSCVRKGCTADVLIALGLVYACVLGYHALLQLWRFLCNYVLASTSHLRSLGQWAVVTGATDGIGKAYAEELARAGLNVFIISRTQSKLDQCQAELAENFPQCEIRTLAVDFSGGPEVYEPLRRELSDLDVGVLVNNVGVGYEYPMQYHEMSAEAAGSMVNVNVLSMALMTQIVIQGMVQRRRGAIVNVSSASALEPTAYLSLYSGTKAFADFFSRAMEIEYAGSGVTIQSITPFFVATKLAKIRRARFDAPSPKAFCRSAVKTIGISTRTQGYWVHSMQAAIFFRWLPSWLVNYFVVRASKKMRNTALRKKEKAATEKKAE